jgi:predicted dinucleotide-binding enzyme
MQIAIFGTGNIGGNLGQALVAKGHQIVYGVRDPHSPKTQAALSALGASARASTLAEAAKASDIIFLALPWQAVAEALQNTGDLRGKTLVDCTNRPGVAVQAGHSSLEEVASFAPGAHVLKAFNMVAAETFHQPHFGQTKAAMFYCGDEQGDKATLQQLGEEIGYDMYDLGGLANGYLMDALFQTWAALAFGQKLGRRLAFKVLSAQDDTP